MTTGQGWPPGKQGREQWVRDQLADYSAGQAAFARYYRDAQEPPAWAALSAEDQAGWDCVGLAAQVPGRFAPLARLARRALPVAGAVVAAVALMWLVLLAVSHGGG